MPLRRFGGPGLSHLARTTRSGFTPQYKGLEALYKKYKDQGFVILGFPCNQVRSSLSHTPNRPP